MAYRSPVQEKKTPNPYATVRSVPVAYALFRGCGIRTGHPVADGVPRCGAKYPKRLLQHAVPFSIPHPVRPALVCFCPRCKNLCCSLQVWLQIQKW
jgi:hypothetical protein